MLIKIRNNVFETNSSSMHSISLIDGDNFTYTKESAINDLIATGGPNIIHDRVFDYREMPEDCKEFSWGIDVFTDFAHKLGYAMTSAYNKTSNEVDERQGKMNKTEILAAKLDKTTDFGMLCEWVKEFLDVDEIIFDVYDDDYCDSSEYAVGEIDHQSTDTLEDVCVNEGISFVDFILNTKYVLVISNDNC